MIISKNSQSNLNKSNISFKKKTTVNIAAKQVDKVQKDLLKVTNALPPETKITINGRKHYDTYINTKLVIKTYGDDESEMSYSDFHEAAERDPIEILKTFCSPIEMDK